MLSSYYARLVLKKEATDNQMYQGIAMNVDEYPQKKTNKTNYIIK